MKKIYIFAIIFFVLICHADGKLRDDRMEKLDKLRMTPKTFDKMKNLHKNTYYTAVKAIIGKMGSILYKQLPKMEQKFLARCLDKIEDRRELITSAKCVVTARKRLLKMKAEMTKSHLLSSTPRPPQHWKAFLQKFDDFDRLHSFTSQSETFESNSTANSTSTFVPFKQPMNGIFKEKNARSSNNIRFSPRKPKKNNFMEASRIPFSLRQLKSKRLDVASIKKSNMTTVSRHSSSNPLTRFPLKRWHKLNSFRRPNIVTRAKLNPPPTNAKQRKTYTKLNFLSKKLKNLPFSKSSKSQPKKKLSSRFQKFMYRSKRNAWFEDSKDNYYKEKKYIVVTKNEINELSEKQKTDNPIISSITNIIREFTAEDSEGSQEDENKGNEHLKWTKTYNRLIKVRNAIDEQKRVPGAKVYEHRMYDLVLERDEPSLAPSERRSPQGLIHESMKLLANLNAKSNGTASFSRLFSPRFMPLMPLNEGKRQPDTYLSPTIMAMYDEPNSTNGITVGNVPKVMNTLGITPKDQGKIMQTLMDVSKTHTYIDESMKIYDVLGMFDEDIGDPLLSATEKILGAFKKLHKNLLPNQKQLFENQGFAYIKKQQMEQVLKDQGHTDDEIDLADFDIYDQMSDEEMEISLWKTIENIAMNKTDVLRPSEVKRFKRDKIFFLSPTVLSPLLFTVQTGILIIGPLVISPTAFAPPILNPSIFSPWLMSPGIFDPLILSPYIMTPFILGPLAFTPFILTPYFLSPNVLNPYVITSLILSPIGLSPDVLSPQAIGATILSPSILSPPVLNPTIYTTSMFSPSFLS